MSSASLYTMVQCTGCDRIYEQGEVGATCPDCRTTGSFRKVEVIGVWHCRDCGHRDEHADPVPGYEPEIACCNCGSVNLREVEVDPETMQTLDELDGCWEVA